MTTASAAPDGEIRPGPSAASIVVRRRDFGLSEELPVHWFDDNPVASHFLDALSSTFPGGEAFFVRSVLHFKKQITDPELLADIQAFAAQEGQHSHQHDLHLKLLYERYPALATRNRVMVRVLKWSNRVQPKSSLAATAALEHMTALLARKLMGHPEQWTHGPMHESMAQLWEWHALEESEHKAVAYDVLQQVAPNRMLRSWMLFCNTLGLLFESIDRCAYMLWKDGLLFRWRNLRDAYALLLGRPGKAGERGRGLLRGMGRDYRAWYRSGFHPNDVDDGELIEATRRRVDDAPAEATARPA